MNVRFAELLRWLKRATGIGYNPDHLLREAEATERLRVEAEANSQKIAKALDRLEKQTRYYEL